MLAAGCCAGDRMSSHDRFAQGKTCVVTGANRGMGFEIARQLATDGATVIMVCHDARSGRGRPSGTAGPARRRRLRRGRSVRPDANQGCGSGAGYGPPDDRCVDQQRGRTHDERRLTVDGIEANLAVNHLASHLLTRLLSESDRSQLRPNRERRIRCIEEGGESR